MEKQYRSNSQLFTKLEKVVADETNDKSEEVYEVEEVLNKKLDTDMNYRHKYIWPFVIVHAAMQLSWLIGIYTLIYHAKWATIIWTFCIGFFVAESVAIGSHRYFSHKSFKVTTPLKIAFIFFQTMSGQNSLFRWIRDHKLHHKYSDTDADPHNASRGFFFSHIGWLLVKRHPLLIQKQKQIDVSDLLADKLIMFQYKYFLHIYFVTAVLLPVSVPMYFWNETLWSSFFVAYCFQYVTNLHITWTINSVAHLWGYKTYDRRIRATQSLITWFITAGEGWHNFHHAFPWDSRISEYGQVGGLSTAFLNLLMYLGLAYDAKMVSPDIIFGHMKRHGDEVGQRKILEKERSKTQMDYDQWMTILEEKMQ